MAKAKKIARMESPPPASARGRTAQTTPDEVRPTKMALQLEQRTEANRPIGNGGGKNRGDRRDMSKMYTDTAKHSARGNNPRPDVKTRAR